MLAVPMNQANKPHACLVVPIRRSIKRNEAWRLAVFVQDVVCSAAFD
jgi:hypothetical protein